MTKIKDLFSIKEAINLQNKSINTRIKWALIQKDVELAKEILDGTDLEVKKSEQMYTGPVIYHPITKNKLFIKDAAVFLNINKINEYSIYLNGKKLNASSSGRKIVKDNSKTDFYNLLSTPRTKTYTEPKVSNVVTRYKEELVPILDKNKYGEQPDKLKEILLGRKLRYTMDLISDVVKVRVYELSKEALKKRYISREKELIKYKKSDVSLYDFSTDGDIKEEQDLSFISGDDYVLDNMLFKKSWANLSTLIVDLFGIAKKEYYGVVQFISSLGKDYGGKDEVTIRVVRTQYYTKDELPGQFENVIYSILLPWITEREEEHKQYAVTEGGRPQLKAVTYSGTTYDEIKKILEQEINKIDNQYEVTLEVNEYEGFISFVKKVPKAKAHGAFFLEIAGDMLIIVGITVPEDLKGKGLLTSVLQRVHKELNINKCRVVAPQNRDGWEKIVAKSGMVWTPYEDE